MRQIILKVQRTHLPGLTGCEAGTHIHAVERTPACVPQTCKIDHSENVVPSSRLRDKLRDQLQGQVADPA